MRTEFERHRYVSQLPVVDMLLFQSHAEYQVLHNLFLGTMAPANELQLVSARIA